MNIRLLRLVPVVLCLIVLAWFLPKNYLRVTKGERCTVSGHYSPLTDEFILWDYGPKGLSFRKAMGGHKCSSLEARKYLPFIFYNDVLKRKGFPLCIGGRNYSYQDAAKTHSFRFFPGEVFAQKYPLHFLMEASPKTADLSMPDSLMILDEDKVRFVECNTGKEKQEQGKIFTQAMLDAGVVFPIIVSATNSNPRKKFDEGMVFIDSTNKLFQIKQIEKLSFCKYLNYTFKEKPLSINVDENIGKKYFAEVATEKGVYLVTYKKGVVRLPLPFYKPDTSVLKVWSKPVYQSVILKDSDEYGVTHLLALNESWEQKAAHTEPCPKTLAEHKTWVDYGLSMLSPFRLERYVSDNPQTLLYLTLAPDMKLAAAACVIWMLVYLFLTGQRYPGISLRPRLRRQALEILIVVVTGLPGLLSLWIFGPLTGKIQQRG